MHRWQAALYISALIFLLSIPLHAQVQPPSDKLLIDAAVAYTWSDGQSNIVQLKGPLTIKSDRMELSAQQGVIWLTNAPGTILPEVQVEIALVGDVIAKDPARGVTRAGPTLFVTVNVRGDIHLTAQRVASDQSTSAVFQQAQAMRSQAQVAPPPLPDKLPPNRTVSPELLRYLQSAATPVAPRTAQQGAPIRAYAKYAHSVPTGDNTLAYEMSGNVVILQTRQNNDFLELRADRAVLFTKERATGALQDVGPMGGQMKNISGAYLEGDVRIGLMPGEHGSPEQRMWAQRVYYDFDHDQAILTDVVLRTSDSQTLLPITIRAEKLRQLSIGEFTGEKVEMSTSSFATPTYSVKTDQVYIRQDQVPASDDGPAQSQTNFVSTNDTLRFAGLPVFYTPEAAGTIDQDPFPLRSFNASSTKRLGFGITSEYGLYELAGKEHPRDLDLTILADYYSTRGAATGIGGNYSGNNIDQDTKDFTDFSGDFKSFIISDHGTDQLGGEQSDVDPPDAIRGKFLFEHQQFLPDNWQVQFRYGYLSDPTFLEEYNPNEWFDNQPYDTEAYFKRQQDTEAITFLANADTNRFVTTSEREADQFDVEKLPEIGYQRIGDSVDDDQMTFFSDNSADRLRFDKSHFSLADQGYVGITPGVPSEGYTGTVTSPTYRGDSRQELDYPIQLGQIKMVPFAIGRATAYSNTPSQNSLGRIYGAVGVRMTTDFWRVDDSIQSDVFDLNRVRHIIEPEISLYTSGETVDRDQLYIYDEDVDGISDVSAAEIALHQRWETYRGPPGRQVSVAFFSLNVYGDMFTNSPTDAGITNPAPIGGTPNPAFAGVSLDKFRGIYFASDPEASIPRDAINSDATWLISDSTAVLADADYNADHQDLATASIGFAARRGDRLAYYVGLRYIEQLNSTLATFAAQYQLTTKYFLEFSQTYDFGLNADTSSEITVRRDFDRLSCSVGVFHDSTTGDSGFTFEIYPQGLGSNRQSPEINSFFNPQ